MGPRARRRRGFAIALLFAASPAIPAAPAIAEAPATARPQPIAEAPSTPPPNTLGAEERAAGWTLLFDGRSFAGWKNYGRDPGTVEGWRIVDGALEFTRDVSLAHLVWNLFSPFGSGVLDLMTTEKFGDFELALEWNVSAGGNSGIFYRVPDEKESIGWFRALEMQVLDDAGHADGELDKRRAGDLYDLVASSRRVVKPAGEWNAVRIRVEGDRIEHWMNGERVVALEIGSPAWDRALAASKHADVLDYGRAREGYILLQDHGDPVRYRNIKLRRLGSANGR